MADFVARLLIEDVGRHFLPWALASRRIHLEGRTSDLLLGSDQTYAVPGKNSVMSKQSTQSFKLIPVMLIVIVVYLDSVLTQQFGRVRSEAIWAKGQP